MATCPHDSSSSRSAAGHDDSAGRHSRGATRLRTGGQRSTHKAAGWASNDASPSSGYALDHQRLAVERALRIEPALELPLVGDPVVAPETKLKFTLAPSPPAP